MPEMMLRRLALCVGQVFLLSLLVFIMTEFMPGDALTGRISPNVTGAQLTEMREKLGLNQPWNVRYVQWLNGLMHGDFGVSYTHKIPVAQLVGEKFTNTLRLGLFSLLLCFGISIPLGVAAGKRHGQWPDKTISAGSYALMSIPQAVFGILAIFLFSYTLQWFPAGGSFSTDAASTGRLAQAVNRLRHSTLPALTSALLNIPILIQLVRSEVITQKKAEYISALHSRGLTDKRIFWVHILRNSLIPASSLSGSLAAAVLSGTVLVESLFSYPGIGKLFVDSVLKRDYPVAGFLILLSSLFAVAGTLLSDLAMHRLDPRIKMC